jgi:hypothetical protein
MTSLCSLAFHLFQSTVYFSDTVLTLNCNLIEFWKLASFFGPQSAYVVKPLMQNEEDNDNLAYWLSNTSSLLFLLQRSLKAAGAPGSVSRKKPPQPTSLFGRMAQGLRSASFVNMHVEATDVVRQVEAKYPALLFKQQLTAYVEKIYGIIRDNIKKELSSLISLCIQAPRTMKASMLRMSGRLSGQAQSNHWQRIIESLDILLKKLQDNHVCVFLCFYAIHFCWMYALTAALFILRYPQF